MNKIKLLVVGLLNISFAFYLLSSMASSAFLGSELIGAFTVIQCFVALITLGIAFIVFFKAESNKFFDISIGVDIFMIAGITFFYLAGNSTYFVGSHGIGSLGLGFLSLILLPFYIVTITSFALGVARYFENRKTQIN